MDLHTFTVDLDIWGTFHKSGPLDLLFSGCKLSLDSACMVLQTASDVPQVRIPYHNIDYVQKVNAQTIALILKTNDIWRIKFGHSSELSQAGDRLQQLKSGSLESAKTYAVTFDMPELRDDATNDLGWDLYSFDQQVDRMKLDLTAGLWRLSNVNKDWTLCDSMPECLIVPAAVSDDKLLKVAQFRCLNRIPYLTYYHSKTSAFISRTSQPLIGTKGRRSLDDEDFLKTMFSCRQKSDDPDNNSNLPCIVDTRTKQNASSAKMRGGGSESDGNYVAIRTFFTTIEQPATIKDIYCKFIDTVRNADVSTSSYLNDTCGWFRLVQSCLRTAVFVAKTVSEQGAPVLVHCDEGTDNSSLVCSLAKLFIDPYFRTMKGFMVLVEEEWIQAGYRFSERSNLSTANSSGSGSTTIGGISLPGINISSASQGSIFAGSLSQIVPVTDAPLFILFLDCVYQAWAQFPTEFEFNQEFMCSLLQHTTSSQFGTFLNNTPKEYREMRSQSLSLWSYYNAPAFRHHFMNPFYKPLFGSVVDAPYLPVSSNPKLLHLFSGFYDPFFTNSQLANWNAVKFRVDITGPLRLISEEQKSKSTSANTISLMNRKKMELDGKIREKESAVAVKLQVMKLHGFSISAAPAEVDQENTTNPENAMTTSNNSGGNGNWDPLMNSA